MRRKNILKEAGVLLVAAILILTALFVFTPITKVAKATPVSGNIIYVDTDAPNDPGPNNPSVSDPLEDGSFDHPFDRIHEGVDVANDGDTVYVYCGFYLESPEYVYIAHSINLIGENKETTIIDGGYYYIVVGINADRVNISGFTIQHNGPGYDLIVLYQSRYSTISGNIIRSGLAGDGIFMYQSCSDITIKENVIYDVPCAVRLGGDRTIIKDNSISTSSGYGITPNSKYNVITGNTISNCYYGIYSSSYNSQYNTITGNTISSNLAIGIFLWMANNNTIEGNTISMNSEAGIYLVEASNNTFFENIITENYYGLYIRSSSNYNKIFDNELSDNNVYGICVYNANFNNITRNIISYNNEFGICFSTACGNLFYHNNVIDNTIQAVDSNPASNHWHHPILLEGNYWSDYLGVDDGSGTGKHAIAGDGIGDTIIPHPTTDYDFYPFTGPWSPSLEVYVDIKPGSWPNPINIKDKGVIPVAICGTEDFNVYTVDPATIRITINGVEEGVAPLRWSYEDAATPWTGAPGGGHDLTGDGYLDLCLKFSNQAVVNILGLHKHLGETLPLTIKGVLKEDYGSLHFEGQDYVWILNNHQWNHPLLSSLLERFPNAFPILRHILGY
jgi:parallel beta-helix repeat protein